MAAAVSRSNRTNFDPLYSTGTYSASQALGPAFGKVVHARSAAHAGGLETAVLTKSGALSPCWATI